MTRATWLTCLFLYAAPVHADDGLVGRWVALRASNYPQNFVRHRNFLGETTPVASELDRKDASFHMVPGLAGGGTVSFESSNYPGHFLRHQSFRVKLQRFDGSELFRKDASFVPQAGAAGQGVTFRASNFPEHALRHCSFHLFIDKNDGSNPACAPDDATYRADISFVVESAPILQRVSLQSVNYPDRWVRHCSFLGVLDNNTMAGCTLSLQRQDSTFLMGPGLSGGNSVSFESVNYPGHFLRHQGFRIKLQPNDGSDLFAKDASFDRVPGLAGSDSSLRSVNYPNRYLRHCSFKLYLDGNDGSNHDCAPDGGVYQKDVTFRVSPGLL